jgi:hypothetical protein
MKKYNLKLGSRPAYPFTNKRKALAHKKKALKNGYKSEIKKFNRIYFVVKKPKTRRRKK